MIPTLFRHGTLYVMWSCASTCVPFIELTRTPYLSELDFGWLRRPEYAFGSNEAGKPTRGAKRKASKAEPFVDDGTLETFTVAQVASLLSLSPDTIRRMFANEPGVIPLGDEHPRGKRRRVTLRIPRAVLERVKRKRAKK